MFSLMKDSGKTYNNLCEFLADKKSDIDNLPINIAIGSICLVIEGPEVYILNNEREWVLL